MPQHYWVDSGNSGMFSLTSSDGIDCSKNAYMTVDEIQASIQAYDQGETPYICDGNFYVKCYSDPYGGCGNNDDFYQLTGSDRVPLVQDAYHVEDGGGVRANYKYSMAPMVIVM